MRTLVALGLLLVATSADAGDLVVHQRSTTSLSGSGSRDETVYLTRDVVVTDSTAARTIVDLERRTITSVDKPRRAYAVVTFDEIAAQMDALRKQAAQMPPEVRRQMGPLLDDGPPVTVKATGKRATIAGYPAVEYALEGGPYVGSVWATDAIPTPPAFQKWKAIDRNSAPGAGRQLGEAMEKIRGFPLRTRIETHTPGQTVVLSNEVIDVKEAAPPAEVLSVPKGYVREQTPPGPPPPMDSGR